jgi:Cdc6-like AAA superfamily ATPase
MSWLKIPRWFGRKASASEQLKQEPPFPTLAEQLAARGGRRPALVPERFPSFQATANDQVNIRGDHTFTRTRMKLLEAFTPSQPVGDRKRFAGRVEILTALIRALEEQRLHVVLYGARGLGKTSAMHVLTQAARDARYLVVYVSCGSDSNFDDVFRTVAANIPMLFHSSVGPTSPEVEKGKTLADILPSGPISARLASDMLAKIVGTRVVVVLDEFDRCESALFRRDVAELIKNLSDRLVRVQLVIAGVAANLVELLEHIPSIQRNIYPLQVPWMTAAEIRQLIKNGESLSGLRFDDPSVRAISMAAHGSPYLASLICHHAGLGALDHERTSVSLGDALEAIATAAQEFKSRLSTRAVTQLQDLMDEGHVGAMGALAGACLSAGNSVRRADLRDAIAALDGHYRADDIVSQLVARDMMVASMHEGVETYRFTEDGIPPYLWLTVVESRLRNGKSSETVRHLKPAQALPGE